MKNIHILPTDSPIQTLGIGLKLGINNSIFLDGVMQNIYITNDEEIKVNDYITDGYKVWQWKDDSSLLGRKKIILTTDQDLITNGVQAVEEDFLKWFVKNPSCEFVEVENERIIIDDINYNFDVVDYKYKIIIPKEEQCTCEIGHPYNNACCKIHGNIPKEEPKQDLEKEMFELEQELDIPSHLRWHNSKPKQKTLEEVIGMKAHEYSMQYVGTDKYTVSMLAIQFGYQLALEQFKKK